jgi:hypothetical protein
MNFDVLWHPMPVLSTGGMQYAYHGWGAARQRHQPVVAIRHKEDPEMAKPTQRIQRVFVCSTCALALSATGGSAYESRQNRGTRLSSRPPPPGAQEPDIAEAATAARDFHTLVKAVVVADLHGTLRGEGPFTPRSDGLLSTPVA